MHLINSGVEHIRFNCASDIMEDDPSGCIPAIRNIRFFAGCFEAYCYPMLPFNRSICIGEHKIMVDCSGDLRQDPLDMMVNRYHLIYLNF